MRRTYSVLQNTSFLTAASILQKIISFAYFTLVARLIGVTNTGQYFFALTFTTIFAIIADGGFGPVLTREVAKNPAESRSYFNTVLSAKLTLGVAAYGLLLGSAWLLGYPQTTLMLLVVAGLTMMSDNVHAAVYSVFRGQKNLRFEAAGIVGSQLLTLFIGTAALLLGAPLVWLLLAYLVPSCLNVLYASFFLHRTYQIRFHFQFNGAVFRTFFVFAVPFALSGLLSRLYAYSDTLLMSKLLGPEHLGWWSVPYKITFAFQFIPLALSAGLYPEFSRLSITDPKRLSALAEQSWKYLALIVLPLVVGLIIVARPVVVALYGEGYLPSVVILKILLISLVFTYLSFISGSLLNATNHQKWQTGLLALALSVNVLCNLWLIPRLGILGAAIAALIASAVLSMGGLVLGKHFFALQLAKFFHTSLQAMLPALLMGAAVYTVFKVSHFALAIVTGLIVYPALVVLFGVVSRTTIKELYRQINSSSNSTSFTDSI